MVFWEQLNVLICGDTRAEYFFIMDEANTPLHLLWQMFSYLTFFHLYFLNT